MTETTRTDPAYVAALIDEATKKSGLVWVAPVPEHPRWYDEAPRPYAVWLLWHEGAAYVLTGPHEQPAPGLPTTHRAVVTVRSKDKGGRLVSWLATVETLTAADEEAWGAVVPLLMAKRLNLPDGEAAAARWAAGCVVCRLAPTGQLVDSPADPPTGSGALPPPDSPATTQTTVPFTVGGATSRPPRRRRPR